MNEIEQLIEGLPDFNELIKKLGTPDEIFDAWRDASSDRHWKHFDLSALRLGYELGKALSVFTRPASVPDGWVMVPVFPTDGMTSTGVAALSERGVELHDHVDCAYTYSRMLAASPQPPVQESVTGLSLIAAERKRHIDEEGWTPKHDDEHKGGEMADAAACYADAAGAIIRGADPLELHNPAKDYSHYEGMECGPVWPWDSSWLKLSSDPMRSLVKAGALIVAEIDRLLRAQALQRAGTTAISGDPIAILRSDQELKDCQ